jgi:hypothetical protein
MADDERELAERATMDKVRITVTKILVGPTVRIKFDIIAYRENGAQHFGFVRFFALQTTEIMRPPDRKKMAQILRDEHAAAWARYHYYVET